MFPLRINCDKKLWTKVISNYLLGDARKSKWYGLILEIFTILLKLFLIMDAAFHSNFSKFLENLCGSSGNRAFRLFAIITIFASIFQKVHWVRSLEIPLKVNFLCQTLQDEAYSLLLVKNELTWSFSYYSPIFQKVLNKDTKFKLYILSFIVVHTNEIVNFMQLTEIFTFYNYS